MSYHAKLIITGLGVLILYLCLLLLHCQKVYLRETKRLKRTLREARGELAQHSWGDFHYEETAQDAVIVAMLDRIDEALGE